MAPTPPPATGFHMPYKVPASSGFQSPRATRPGWAPPKPSTSGATVFAGATPQARLGRLLGHRNTPAVPRLAPAAAPLPSSKAPAVAGLRPEELRSEQRRIQRMAQASEPRYLAQAKSRYEAIAQKLEQLGTNRADRPATASWVKKLLGGEEPGLAVHRLQAAIVALGKGHYLGHFGRGGIDGKRGFFTAQAVERVQAELGAKSEAEILDAARRKLGGLSASVASESISAKKSPSVSPLEGASVDPNNAQQVGAVRVYAEAIRDMRQAKTREEFRRAQDRAVTAFEGTGFNNKYLFELVGLSFGKMPSRPLAGEGWSGIAASAGGDPRRG